MKNDTMKNQIMLAGLVLAVQATTPAVGQSNDGPKASEELQEIVIFSRGATRQQQSLGSEQIAYLPSGTSPLKAIEKLPGVNFQAADPFGAYEWSTRIVVRGFNQNQMGFTLDGIPLGDMSYGTITACTSVGRFPPKASRACRLRRVLVLSARPRPATLAALLSFLRGTPLKSLVRDSKVRVAAMPRGAIPRSSIPAS